MLVAAGVVQASEASTSAPYAVLYRALEPALAIDAYPRLRAIRRVESKLPGVQATDIRLVIARADGPIEIRPAADGSIDFPLDAALLAENPPVRSNQPRGSLVLSATLALATPATRAVPAAVLTAALDDADRLLGADGSPSRAAGVEFQFPPQARATATIEGPAERTLVADHAGRIVLLRDRDLDGNPGMIELSAIPTLVLPWLGNPRNLPGAGRD